MKLIVILGPTASGKTLFASHLAKKIDGEIISADSRQVFRRMSIGTGKDLADYIIDGTNIPYHLIDIREPGTEFSVYDFQQEFIKAYTDINLRKKLPVLCGGTGLYLESILKPYVFSHVPENTQLRKSLSDKSDKELITELQKLKKLHNKTDTVCRERTIRAIEIAVFQQNDKTENLLQNLESSVFGLNTERQKQKDRITERLKTRFEQGMIEEVEALINEGVKPERLKSYGLEYKFITQFILGELKYENMFTLLNTAIHQFSKRQMTWFRHMEKNGIKINWIDGDMPLQEKLEYITEKTGIDF